MIFGMFKDGFPIPAHCTAAESKRCAHSDGTQTPARGKISDSVSAAGVPNGNTTPSPEY